MPQLPQTSTIAESGVLGFEVIGWLTMFAPKGTPDGIVDKINEIINQAESDRELRKTVDAASMTPTIYSPKEAENYIADEYAKWGAVIKAANLSKN